MKEIIEVCNVKEFVALKYQNFNKLELIRKFKTNIEKYKKLLPKNHLDISIVYL